MSANRAREVPDATPPFLTREVIDGWIEAAMSAERLERERQYHGFDKGQLHLIHQVEKLAGDGKDQGAVGRLEALVTNYINEHRQSSQMASQERQQLNQTITGMVSRIDALEDAGRSAKRVEAQVMRWKLIPGFTHNLWKILAAIVGLTLAVTSIWSKFHPQPVSLSPQQIQEIRKSQ